MNFKGHSSAHNKYRRQEVERKQLSQFLGRLIRTWTPLGSPRRRKGSGALEMEIGVWNSQGGGKDKHLFFFFSTFLSLSHIKCFFFFFFKPRADDYTTQFKLYVHAQSLQSCPTLCHPMDHGILQARILEWVAIPFCSYKV